MEPKPFFDALYCLSCSTRVNLGSCHRAKAFQTFTLLVLIVVYSFGRMFSDPPTNQACSLELRLRRGVADQAASVAAQGFKRSILRRDSSPDVTRVSSWMQGPNDFGSLARWRWKRRDRPQAKTWSVPSRHRGFALQWRCEFCCHYPVDHAEASIGGFWMSHEETFSV